MQQPVQQNLFDQPTINGAMHDLAVAMDHVIEASGYSRPQAVDLLNKFARRYGVRLVPGNGKSLSTATLEKWVNPNEEQRYPSYKALLVFCAVFDNVDPVAALTGSIHCQVISGQDVQLLAWAKEYHRVKAARVRMKRLEEHLG